MVVSLTYTPDIGAKYAVREGAAVGLGPLGPREGPHAEHEVEQGRPRQQLPCMQAIDTDSTSLSSCQLEELPGTRGGTCMSSAQIIGKHKRCQCQAVLAMPACAGILILTLSARGLGDGGHCGLASHVTTDSKPA